VLLLLLVLLVLLPPCVLVRQLLSHLLQQTRMLRMDLCRQHPQVS
jgi:hypothetical protein